MLDVQGCSQQGSKGQAAAQDLSAAFAIAAIDLDHLFTSVQAPY
jgi:hypothetical protein